MTASEIQEELDAIRAARLAIYKTGVSYSRNGLQLTRASLPSLMQQERMLNIQLRRMNNGGVAYSDFRGNE